MASINDLPPEIRAQIPAAALGSIVNVAQSPSGGWYAVGKDGGVFSLGGAGFQGSLGGTKLNSEIVDIVPTQSGKGYYLVGADGGIFSFGDAKFQGALPGLQGDTLAGQHKIGTGGFKLNSAGGYSLTDTEGRAYDFGPKAPKANPLYSDPDFLAFTRAADYTIDAAAADVARRQGAINRALANDLTTLADSRDKDLTGVDNSHEARGVYRGGARLRDRSKTEADYANREGQVRDQRTQEITEIGSSLTNTVAGLQQKAAELGYGTAGEQALGQGYEAVQKKYPGLFPITTKSPANPV